MFNPTHPGPFYPNNSVPQAQWQYTSAAHSNEGLQSLYNLRQWAFNCVVELVGPEGIDEVDFGDEDSICTLLKTADMITLWVQTGRYEAPVKEEPDA